MRKAVSFPETALLFWEIQDEGNCIFTLKGRTAAPRGAAAAMVAGREKPVRYSQVISVG